MIGNLLVTGALTSQIWPYYLSVGLVASHLAHQVNASEIFLTAFYEVKCSFLMD